MTSTLIFLFERSRENSSDEKGIRFSFCDEKEEELDMDDEDSEGEANRDMERSSGLSAKGTKVHKNIVQKVG